MPTEIVAALTFLACAMIALLVSQWRQAREISLERRVLEHGMLTTGKIIAINRPIGSRHQTHVYFSFELPAGSFLRSCCIDLRALKQHSVLFPSVGAEVSVRYLPEDPGCAVIPHLARCVTGAARLGE